MKKPQNPKERKRGNRSFILLMLLPSIAIVLLLTYYPLVRRKK